MHGRDDAAEVVVIMVTGVAASTMLWAGDMTVGRHVYRHGGMMLQACDVVAVGCRCQWHMQASRDKVAGGGHLSSLCAGV